MFIKFDASDMKLLQERTCGGNLDGDRRCPRSRSHLPTRPDAADGQRRSLT